MTQESGIAPDEGEAAAPEQSEVAKQGSFHERFRRAAS
jgi:hypothetical protein